MPHVSVGERLAQLAATAPDRPAVTAAGATVTRRALDQHASNLAAAYRDLGVRPDDLVAVGLPNGIDFLAATIAVWKLGATPLPLPPALPPRELDALLDLGKPRLVVGVADDAASGWRSVPPGFQAPNRKTSRGRPPVPAALKAMASGGSTGRPKLIVSAQPGVFDTRAAQLLRIRPEGVQLVCGPLYHNGPFAMATNGQLAGQHLVVLDRFDPLAALDAIERHRVTFVSLVPTMMLRIVRVLDEGRRRFDLSSLETVWHLAAPCPPWLKQRWIDLVGPDRLLELYSGTEGQAMTVISGTEWLAHRGSVGRPVLGEITVLDSERRPVDPGVVGEVFLRPGAGAGPTYRYVGAEARRAGDGWESLGDLGWLDEDGYLYLCDRRIDLIVSGGVNVYPAEVEAAVMEHPDVTSCVVVGLPDADLGQRVHAVVESPGAELSPEDLQAFVAERVSRAKQPRSYRIVDERLRDDAGKVRRSALAAAEIEAHAKTTELP